MNDDLNHRLSSHSFSKAPALLTISLLDKATISAEDLEELKSIFHLFRFDILA